MYLLEIKGLQKQSDSTLTLETEDRRLARSVYLLLTANGFETTVLKEAEPKPVKFKGTP